MDPQELTQEIQKIDQIDIPIDQCDALQQLIVRIGAELPCETEEALSDWIEQAANSEAALKKVLPKLVSLFRKFGRRLGDAIKGSPLILEAIVRSVGLKATGLVAGGSGGSTIGLRILITQGTGESFVCPPNPDLERDIAAIRKSAFTLINESGNFGAHCDADYDVEIRFDHPYPGNSFGLLIGILIVCQFAGLSFPDKASATGQLDGGGRVNTVTGLPEKLEAARQGGISHVFIPADQNGNFPEPPVTLPVSSLREAVRGLFPGFPYPRWYFEMLRETLLPEEVSHSTSKTLERVRAAFNERVTGDLNSRYVKYPRKVTVGRAIELTKHRMMLRGSRKVSTLITQEVAAHYVKLLLEGHPQRAERIIPVLVDLQQYGWAGKHELVDLVAAELRASNAEFKREFLQREIYNGKILLLCRKAPSNSGLRRALTGELHIMANTASKIILYERAIEGPIGFPRNNPMGSWRRKVARLLPFLSPA